MKNMVRGLMVCLSIMLAAGCAQYENKRGVEVNWQGAITDQLVPGQSNRRDVLRLLGPPSQVISLEDGTVLYYLFERSKGNGLILIVYNRMTIDTHYDRAVFFFDQDDTLTEFATRIDEPSQG